MKACLPPIPADKVFMNKPLFVVTRTSHIEHLIRLLPFITLLFLGQCFLLRSLIQNVEIGNLCLMMGSILIMLVGLMYYYDVGHSVEVHQNHIVSDFPPFMERQIIQFKDIADIRVSDIEMDFSNVKIILHSGDVYSVFFVDHPREFYEVLKNQMFNIEHYESAA